MVNQRYQTHGNSAVEQQQSNHGDQIPTFASVVRQNQTSSHIQQLARNDVNRQQPQPQENNYDFRNPSVRQKKTIVNSALPGKPFPTDGSCISISHKDPKLTQLQVETHITSNIKIKTLGIKVLRLSRVSGARVVAVCLDPKHGEKLHSHIQENSETLQLNSMVVRKRRPLLTLSRVPNTHALETLLEEIKEHTDGLTDLDTSQIKLAYKKNRPDSKTTLTHDMVIECDIKSYHRLCDAKRLYIEYRTIWVNSTSSFKQCYRCQGFGHVSTKCKEELERCGNCSEPHRTKGCPNEHIHRCINCVKYNKNLLNPALRLNINHKAGSNVCQVRVAMQEIAAQMMDTDRCVE